MKISRKRRHEAMLEQGMHAGNTDAKFDPPPQPCTFPKCECGDGFHVCPEAAVSLASDQRGAE